MPYMMKGIMDCGAVQTAELVIIGLNLNSGENMSKIPGIENFKKEGTCPVCGYEISAKLVDTKDGLLRLEVNYNKNCRQCNSTILGIARDLEKMVQEIRKEGVSIKANFEMR